MAEVFQVVPSDEPMLLAKAFLNGFLDGITAVWGLQCYMGDIWEWYGERWCKRDSNWLEDAVWLWMDRTRVQRTSDMTERLSPNTYKVKNVARAVEAIVRLRGSNMPVWLDHRDRDRGHLIGFRDVIVDVAESARKGVLVTEARGKEWFDGTVSPFDFDPGAKCPRWEQCLKEWGNGDADWGELLERFFGYSRMATRKYARGLLQYGKVRGGKNMGTGILKASMGGQGYFGTTMGDLADKHGLDGVQGARVMVISEANEMDKAGGERVSGVVKRVLGRDTMPINPKNIRQMQATLDVTIIIQSNEVLKLPDKGQGVSSKLLMLPYDVSWLNREEYDLEGVLMGELPGINRRFVEAAIRLEAEKDQKAKWPTPQAAADAMRMYRVQASPLESFLESRFVRDQKGFVPGHVIRREFWDYVQKNKVSVTVNDNTLLASLERETGWNVKRHRLGGGGERGMTGLALRRMADDEV